MWTINVLVFIFLLVQVKDLHAQTSRCVPISQCTAAVRLTREKLSHPRTAAILRSAHCGYQNEALVQCDLVEREATSILGTTTTGGNSNNNNCIPISQCSAAQTLFNRKVQNLVALLQSAHCGYAGEAQVKCGILEAALGGTSTTNLNSGNNNNNNNNGNNNNGHNNNGNNNNGDNNNGNNNNGNNNNGNNNIGNNNNGNNNCIPLAQCPEATKLLTTISQQRDIQSVLGSAYCGVENRIIKVDCESLKIEVPTRINKFPNPDNSECGIQYTDGKIVGGEETALEDFPWLGLVYYVGTKKQPGCTGSLITSRYVLTAAHCIDQRVIDSANLGNVYSVVFGEYDLRNDTDCIYYESSKDCADPPREYLMESVIVHKDFQLQMGLNDIGLMRLSEDVVFTEFISPICLPLQNVVLSGNEKFWVGGWGRTETDKRSEVKLKAEVPYVDRAYCSANWRRNFDEKIICAGTDNGVDSCKGDSGGPLMYQDEDTLILYAMGVVSFGHSPCGSGPAVYTFVPRYLDWIENNIV